MEIAEEVSDNGAYALVANSVPDALSALSRLKFGVAIIDHHLRGEDATEVIHRLQTLQIPFVIYTGCDEVGACPNAPIVHKPAARAHLMQTVCDALR